MTKDEALKLALEALEEINKDGSPCPEFWDWLPKAYNFEGNGNFSKYNMEVAFLAGKQASQPEQEPVAFINVEQRKLEWAKYMTWDTPTVVNLPKIPLYTTPPQRTWVGLTNEEIEQMGLSNYIKVVRETEAKLKEKNT